MKLLTRYKSGDVIGKKVALQKNHSQRFAKVFRKVTGNKQLVPYSLRHTGKHLSDTKGVGYLYVLESMCGWNAGNKQAKDNCGKAGIFTRPYI